MLNTLRHLLAIILLPFMVVIAIPIWLFNSFASYDTRWVGMNSLTWTGMVTGGLFVWVGLILFVLCVNLFALIGQGTLAPWDPTKKLIIYGPYRHVRNPMITGVAMMLIGQAIFWGSWIIGTWAGIFILINHVYFIFSEEPGLEKRFGESYVKYKANVPRWVPRLKPWKG